MRLTEQDCRARFTQARVARLATIAQDGSPRIVPITFAGVANPGSPDISLSVVDSKPKSTTALARLARIEREPRVSMLADEYSDEWSHLWWVRAEPPSGAVLRFCVEHWSRWAASESDAASGR